MEISPCARDRERHGSTRYIKTILYDSYTGKETNYRFRVGSGA
jgi:hypothetical protein